MNHNNDCLGRRLKEERLRCGMQQIDLAEACRVSRGGLLKWEKGEAAPNAAVLALMDALGIDVLYVVTGRRSVAPQDMLAPAEKDLLTAWRSGSLKDRAVLSAVVEALKSA